MMMEILNILITSQKEMVDAHKHTYSGNHKSVSIGQACVRATGSLEIAQWHTFLLWILMLNQYFGLMSLFFM
jgi:hypothetical protein